MRAFGATLFSTFEFQTEIYVETNKKRIISHIKNKHLHTFLKQILKRYFIFLFYFGAI